MRKFLTISASATFFGNSLYTARIMKDHLEYIVRNQPGMYAVALYRPSSENNLCISDKPFCRLSGLKEPVRKAFVFAIARNGFRRL